MSGAYRRHWLRESAPILRAADRIASGEVATKDLYDVAMVAFGDEDVASAILAARLEALNNRASNIE